MIDTSNIHLRFLKLSGTNRKILPSHVSLFTAMVLCCKMQGHAQPFRVCRRELMRLSAIRSYNTYHNCIKELVRQGYIDYLPSYSNIVASRVSFLLGP